MLPRLVLHACCAPDEAYVISVLKESYELYCYFSNPNIFPAEEYEKRINEAKDVCEKFGVQFDSPAYDPSLWETAVKGLEDTPEGGERCRMCFMLRMRQTASFCREIGWPAFATVMSISPHKNVSILDNTGEAAAGEYGVNYLPFVFRKKDGFRKSIQLSKELGLYRQDYCGCSLSLDERNVRVKNTEDKITTRTPSPPGKTE